MLISAKSIIIIVSPPQKQTPHNVVKINYSYDALSKLEIQMWLEDQDMEGR